MKIGEKLKPKLKSIQTLSDPFPLNCYYCSQSTSCVTSISENEANILMSLCNVRHVNGMLNILSDKDALTEKHSKYLGNNCYS